MARFKTSLAIALPAVVLAGGLCWAVYDLIPSAGAQEAPAKKAKKQDPTGLDEALWVPSKTELIKDEPLQVTVPTGLPGLFPKTVVPASNPITKGKYELGRQLY